MVIRTRMINGDNKNNGNLLIIIRIILVTIYISVYNVYKYKVSCRSLFNSLFNFSRQRVALLRRLDSKTVRTLRILILIN